MSIDTPPVAPTESQQRFIDDFAQLLVAWGMPLTSGRLYAWLLLSPGPVTLDGFAEGLGISKSNASMAARDLETNGMARRLTERGSKRIRYEATREPGNALLRNSNTLGRLAALIEGRVADVAEGENRVRLLALAEFHLALKAAMDGVIARFGGS
ncbi:MAG: transcriptional regulator [Sphingomonadales bacterium]|nr:transcriptional regulator [Sphingomonadales bacterium]